jgi:hypothetical protein
MNTNRLIGRSSAGVGVMEEIEVGDGLELVLGVLSNTATPTPLGYYGAFQDNQTQSANANDVGVAMIFRRTDLSNGVSIVSDGTNLTRITFCTYGIFLNLQFFKSISKYRQRNSLCNNMVEEKWNKHRWVRLLGVCNDCSTEKTHPNLVLPLFSWNYLLDALGEILIELIWSSKSYQNVTSAILRAGNCPAMEAWVILTVTQQDRESWRVRVSPP